MSLTRRNRATKAEGTRLSAAVAKLVAAGQREATRRGVVGTAVYVRISRDRTGAELGIERQCEDGFALAEKLGFCVTAVYADNDISAYSGKHRPDYERLLADLESGKFSSVITWHSERLHRSPTELERYIDICQPRNIPTHVVRAGVLDLSTAAGRLNARIQGVIARHDSEFKAEKIARQKLQAAQKGIPDGGPRIYGFEPDHITQRPDEAAEIASACEMVVSGASMRSISARFNENRAKRGLPPADRNVLRGVLLRPRNAGLSTYKGEIVGKGAWEPIVSEDTWRAVVSILTEPSRRTAMSNKVRWLGSGLYACGGCNEQRMRVSPSGKANTRVYRCTRTKGYDVKHVSRAAESVDALVSRVIVERLNRSDARKFLVPRAELPDIGSLQAESDTLRQRLNDLAAAFADGDITRSQMKIGSEKINQKLADIEAKLAASGDRSPVSDLVSSPDPRTKWDSLDIGQRRIVVDELVTVTILHCRKGKKSNGSYFDPESIRFDWKR